MKEIEEELPVRLDRELREAQGRRITLRSIREALNVEPRSQDDDKLRQLLRTRVKQKIIAPSGLDDHVYKVVTQVQPIKVFGRERRPPIRIMFPKDYDTGMEMSFADDIVLREGDFIIIGGMSNFGKTALCMNFCGENIDCNPVLMGNEYSTIDNEPSPRFLNRMDAMDWVQWSNGNGEDRFTLLPVRADYAEHIKKDRMNIIDWINLPGEYYLISPIMEGIKREIGGGVAVAALQKNQDSTSARGGSMTKDFTDCELLLDQFGDGDEVLLTIGKVKESKRRVTGRKFAYSISKGVRIINFREVVKCPTCYGKKWKKAGNSTTPCDTCRRTGYVDR